MTVLVVHESGFRATYQVSEIRQTGRHRIVQLVLEDARSDEDRGAEAPSQRVTLDLAHAQIVGVWP